MPTPEGLWTLDELTAQVALALGLDGPRQASGRVRDVPDRRTIRYYGTLGLVDPPVSFRGRTALYGQRHLSQLVAIKRLQARGLTLTEVQQRMLGLTDAKLRELAALPESPTESTAPATETDEPFWKAEPAAPAVKEDAPRSLTAVPLAAGVTLLVEGIATLDEHDMAALRASAAPLLRLLAQRVIDPRSAEPRGLDANQTEEPA
jgi:DNA-binding transcriptional MerR regulator